MSIDELIDRLEEIRRQRRGDLTVASTTGRIVNQIDITNENIEGTTAQRAIVTLKFCNRAGKLWEQ